MLSAEQVEVLEGVGAASVGFSLDLLDHILHWSGGALRWWLFFLCIPAVDYDQTVPSSRCDGVFNTRIMIHFAHDPIKFYNIIIAYNTNLVKSY